MRTLKLMTVFFYAFRHHTKVNESMRHSSMTIYTVMQIGAGMGEICHSNFMKIFFQACTKWWDYIDAQNYEICSRWLDMVDIKFTIIQTNNRRYCQHNLCIYEWQKAQNNYKNTNFESALQRPAGLRNNVVCTTLECISM